MLYPTLWQRTSPALFDDLFDSGVGRMFNRTWNRAAGFPAYRFSRGDSLEAWTPACDITETADAIRVHVELPGMNPDDIDVRVQNNTLTVSGQKSFEYGEGEETTTTYLRERHFGRFERGFTLPSTVVADAMEANYENGLLTLILPKKEEAKARRVQINAGGSTGRNLGSGS